MSLSCNQVNTLSVQYSANNWLEHCCKGQIDKFDHFIDPIDHKYNLRYLSLIIFFDLKNLRHSIEFSSITVVSQVTPKGTIT